MKPTVICQNCDMGWIDFDLGRKMAKAETLKETDEVIAGEVCPFCHHEQKLDWFTR